MADDKTKHAAPAAPAADAVQLAILQALKELTSAVAELKAAKGPKMADVVSADEAKERRAKMKAATKKANGEAQYIVGNEKAYRAGVTYGPGEVISIPEAEEPSLTWKPVVEKKSA